MNPNARIDPAISAPEHLIALQEEIGAEINRALVGSEVDVLVEGPAKRPPGWMAGKTPQLKTVVFPGPAAVGEVVAVRVEATTAHTLTGAGSGRALAARDPARDPHLTLEAGEHRRATRGGLHLDRDRALAERP